MCKCEIPWCNEPTTYGKNYQKSTFCLFHNSLIVGNLKYAVKTLKYYHKVYKWEKFINGEDVICEKCNRNPKKEYPEIPGSRWLMLLDVDHINPKKLGGDYEHPDNYQLLCKSCHGAKSILDKDYYNARHEDKKNNNNNLLDKDYDTILEDFYTRHQQIKEITEKKNL